MRLLDHRGLVAAARLLYAQPHRGYHGAEHLDDAEQAALLFHDAVYVPGAGRGDNERLSALLMRATLPAFDLGPVDLDRAVRIIEATTHAESPPSEAAQVCDLDLWRLAAPWEQFERHALGIRHEYLHLHASEAAFWTARHAFYRSMLAKPQTFATACFRDHFEAAARTNMQRALSWSP